MEEERYAACAGAKVEDAEWAWRRGGGEEEGGEMGCYIFGLWSATNKQVKSASSSMLE